MGLVSMVAAALLSSGFKCYASSNFETRSARAVLTVMQYPDCVYLAEG